MSTSGIVVDLTGKDVLITGGTQGIGYGIAEQFARAGAQLYLTYKWNSANAAEVIQSLERLGAPTPLLIEADVADDEQTRACLAEIATKTKKIDTFISNVAFAPQVNSLADYRKKDLFRTIEYSSWPLVSYLQQIEAVFGTFPKYVLGISSNGPSNYYRGYDFVSAAKALLEHFARYLSIHLMPHEARVNVVRFGTVRTASFDAIFGDEFFEYIKEQHGDKQIDKYILQPERCGEVILALCSGLMDAINGQVISVDYGLPFADNTMMRYLDWKRDRDQKGAL